MTSSELLGHHKITCSIVSGIWHFEQFPVACSPIIFKIKFRPHFPDLNRVAIVSRPLFILVNFNFRLTGGSIFSKSFPFVESFHCCCHILSMCFENILLPSYNETRLRSGMKSWLFELDRRLTFGTRVCNFYNNCLFHWIRPSFNSV